MGERFAGQGQGKGDKLETIKMELLLLLQEQQRLRDGVIEEQAKNEATIREIKDGNWANEAQMLAPFLQLRTALESAVEIFTADVQETERKIAGDASKN